MSRRWPRVQLGAHLRFLTSGSRSWARYYRERGSLFLRVHNLGDDELRLLQRTYVAAPASAEAERIRVRPGDLLLSITADLGRTAVVPDDLGVAYISQHLALLRLDDAFDPRFVSAFLASPDGQRQFERLDKVGVKSGLNLDDVRALRAPLPPLQEQRRIAALLGKARAIVGLRRRAVALTERLVRSAFVSMFGEPIENPKGWPVVPLGEVLGEIEGGYSPCCESRPARVDEWGVLKLGAVSSCTYDAAQHKALVAAEPRPALEVRGGDLLFARKNSLELLGATALVQRTRPRLMFPDLVFRLNLTERAAPAFMWHVLNQSGIRSRVRRLAGGTSGSMPNISKARLRTVEVVLPSLLEQRRFARVVEQHLRVMEIRKAAVRASGELLASLSQGAFLEP